MKLNYSIEIQNLSVNCGEKELSFNYKYSKDLQDTCIEINKDNSITVKTPIEEIFVVKEYIRKKADSILKQIAKHKINKAQNMQNYYNGMILQYFGKDYEAKFKETNHTRSAKVKFKGTEFKVKINPKLKSSKRNDAIEKAIIKFYRKETKEKILPLIEQWASKMKLFPNKISIRKTKRKWISLSAKNNLSVNYNLATRNISFIIYLIVHHLAHIKEKKHNEKFYKIIENYLPNYKTIEENFCSEKNFIC